MVKVRAIADDEHRTTMYDFAPPIAEATAHWYREAGVAPSPAAGKALDLIARGDGCDWEHLALLLDGGFDALGNEQATASLAHHLFTFRELRLFHDTLGALVSPALLFRLILSIGGRLNPLFEAELDILGPDVWRIRLSPTRDLAPPCPPYFLTVAETFRLLPQRALGNPLRDLRLETDGCSCTMTLHLPPSRTLRERLARAWRAFRGDDRLLTLLQSEQAAVLAARRRLIEERRRVETLVRERTAHVDALNLELREASANKSRHLTEMSHELRTPLNAIIGYSELLSEEASDLGATRLQPDLTRIQRAANHLLRLVNNVLDLSKIEAGHLEVEAVPVELGAVIDATCADVRPLIEEHNRFLVERIEAHVVGDPVRIRQILTNLLANAAKFTRDGEIGVTVERHQDRWLVHVADTGRGMDTDALAHAFQPYRQTQTTDEGTGLGLPIARELAHLMQGTLTATSTPGAGSCFTLSLPAVPGGARGASS